MIESERYNNIQNNIKINGISSITTENLIFYLYYSSKNPELRVLNKKKIEDYFYKINRSYFYENIFVNKGNYSQIGIFFLGLAFPFYINYPRMYNLGFTGFFVGILCFVALYQFVNQLYGNFFPIASKLFIIITILIYVLFFLFLNKLNHISLFFLSAIVSFCLINYIYRLKLSEPSKKNTYNQYKVKIKEIKEQTFITYDYYIEQACDETIKRFGLKLPSGKMLYSYLTIFEFDDNKNKLTDFIINIIAPLISLIYNYYLGSYLNDFKNREINNQNLNAIPVLGINEDSNKYINCQANYVLPIEFNFNSFIHEYYTENKLNDTHYRLFLKCLKRINTELLERYQPKFIKLEDISEEELKKHLKANSKKRNHILVELERFFKEKNIPLSFDNNDYLYSLLDFINSADIKDKEKKDAIELYHKLNQTLQIKTNYIDGKIEIKENDFNNKDDIRDNIEIAIRVLLDDGDIDKDTKELLKNLCVNYVETFRKYSQEGILYGYNYNLYTFKYFNRNIRLASNKVFNFIVRLISVYILFARPITSPWLLATFLLIPSIQFDNYFKYFSENNIFMKYLGLGMDSEYFVSNDFDNNKNNPSFDWNLIYKIIIYIPLTLFLQYYNNVFYGLTFTPNYLNIISQGIFIFNLFLLMNNFTGFDDITLNIIYWMTILLILIIIYFVKIKK